PKYAPGHFNLGLALFGKNQFDDAIGAFKEAIALLPNHAPAHTALALALAAKQRSDEAIAESNKALALDPKEVKAPFALGMALALKGQFAEAKTSLQRAVDLVPATDPLRPGFLEWRDKCDAYLGLEAKLPDVLAGKAQVKSSRERLDLLDICRLQQRHAAAA